MSILTNSFVRFIMQCGVYYIVEVNMRVYPIDFGYPVQSRNSPVRIRREDALPQEQPVFRGGNLKAGDYIAGAICGTAAAIVGLAIAGPLGALALGLLGAKTTAEANNETRR